MVRHLEYLVFALFAVSCDPGDISCDSGSTPADIRIENNLQSYPIVDPCIRITVMNHGETDAPANVGNLLIQVEQDFVRDFSLASFPSQNFRTAGNRSYLYPDVCISGPKRRIMARLDTNDEINEGNEYQNMWAKTLDRPVFSGADLLVENIGASPFSAGIAVLVNNIGDTDITNELGRLRVTVDGVVAYDQTTSYTFLAGGFEIIDLPSVSPAPGGSRVFAELYLVDQANVPLAGVEVDNTNNWVLRLLPDAASFLLPYQALLADPYIANALVWRGAQGAQTYPNWGTAMQSALLTHIERIEEKRPTRIGFATAPPPVLDETDGTFSEDHARDVYLVHIAQALWVEVHHVVSWSLFDFSSDLLANLLDSDSLLEQFGGFYRYNTATNGGLTDWNPRVSYEFLDQTGLISSNSQRLTIERLTTWMRSYYRHDALYMDWVPDPTTQIRTPLGIDYAPRGTEGWIGMVPVNLVLYPPEGVDHVSWNGCYGTSSFYRAVLRAINIPVEFGCHIAADGCHSRPIFPSVDRTLIYGDMIWMSYFVLSGGDIPSADMMMTPADYAALFQNPPLDHNPSTNVTNTLAQQVKFNANKRFWQQTFDFFTDHPAYVYAKYGAADLDTKLQGPTEYAFPYFDATERATHISATEDLIRLIGGGDLATGEARVIARFERFGNYRYHDN